MSAVCVDTVRKLVLAGLRVVDIAERLGVTKGVISGVIDRNRLRDETPVPVRVRPPWTEGDIQRVREMAAAGSSYREIGDLYGLAREGARQRMRGLGISTIKPPRAVPKAAEAKRPVRANVAVKPVIVAPVAPASPVVVRLARAGCDCQWPLNDGKPWRFCGAETVPGKPYCVAHVRLSRASSAVADAA